MSCICYPCRRVTPLSMIRFSVVRSHSPSGPSVGLCTASQTYARNSIAIPALARRPSLRTAATAFSPFGFSPGPPPDPVVFEVTQHTEPFPIGLPHSPRSGFAFQTKVIAVTLEDFFHKSGAAHDSAVDEITNPSVDNSPQGQLAATRRRYPISRKGRERVLPRRPTKVTGIGRERVSVVGGAAVESPVQ